jgi:hypothetical protein
VLGLAQIADEGGDPVDQSCTSGKHCFFARRASFFWRLFGRVDFELAYTLLISNCSSVSALSNGVSFANLFSYEEEIESNGLIFSDNAHI